MALVLINSLDMLSLVILHNKRQCNATDTEVRIPSYTQSCIIITQVFVNALEQYKDMHLTRPREAYDSTEH